jgi:hypothetical protein
MDDPPAIGHRIGMRPCGGEGIAKGMEKMGGVPISRSSVDMDQPTVSGSSDNPAVSSGNILNRVEFRHNGIGQFITLVPGPRWRREFPHRK